MKPMKLEFVLFGTSKETAEFIWNVIVKILQSLGFNVTGIVTEYELTQELYVETWKDDWTDSAKHFTNEDKGK